MVAQFALQLYPENLEFLRRYDVPWAPDFLQAPMIRDPLPAHLRMLAPLGTLSHVSPPSSR